jgi:hypothetical protein
MGTHFSKKKKEPIEPIEPIEPNKKDDEFFERSSDVIDDIVNRYLQCEFTNNPLVPDFIERRMYRNVVKLMIGLMKDTLETSQIEVLGHRIGFTFDLPYQEDIHVKETVV